MENKDVKGKIIFVNSFKGGAGKTTLALTHSISNLFHEAGQDGYTNVFYMDLDVLGTAAGYLFEEKKLPEEGCFTNTESFEEIELYSPSYNRTADLYVTYLSPGLKNRSSFGEAHYVNHQEVAEEVLKNKVLHFIRERLKEENHSLFVLDCAPGFSKFEQGILAACYAMAKESKIEIQEDYVTTLDSAHVQKCIQCLNDSQNNFVQDIRGRSIRIIINDMQNYSNYLSKENKDIEPVWLEIGEKVRAGLHNKAIAIYQWKYSQEIAVKTTFGRVGKVENSVDEYMFTGENFVKLEV